MNALRVGGAFAVLLWLCAGPIAAQRRDEPRIPNQEAMRWARDAYRRAEEAFERREDAVALELFRELAERTGNQSIRFNIGVCLERLGQRASAHREFATVSANDSVAPEIRAAALESASRLRAELARLELSGADGTEARLDGVVACTLPCDLWVEPGVHALAIGLGASGVEVDVEVARGETRSVELLFAGQDGGTERPPGPSLGWLTGVGAVLAAIGVAGIVGFGVTTLDLEQRFRQMPNASLAREGNLMRDLTNGSIAVAGIGALLCLIDLTLYLSWSPPSATVTAGRPTRPAL